LFLLFLFFFFRLHPGNDGERLPLGHPLLPHRSVRSDDVETKRVVELIERHHLDVVPRDGDVPNLVACTRTVLVDFDVVEVGRAVRLPIHVRLKR
jgi:hypothetical protein